MPEAAAVDAVFQRKKFLLRQKALAISEKYYVWNEEGKEILFIERPTYLLRNVGAILAGLACGGATIALFVLVGHLAGQAALPWLVLAGIVLGIAEIAAVGVWLSPKRHVYFYRDDTKQQLLLKIEQDRKVAPIVATYTVKDPSENVLARLRKNYLYNLIRKRWTCHGPDGQLISLIQEDSILKAIIRRFVVALKTDFVLFKADTGEELGKFIRKWTILDRYVLDLTPDAAGWLDPRIGLAIGVMLDTGESR